MRILGLFKKGKELSDEIKEVSMHNLEIWLDNFTDSSELDGKIAILKRDISSKVVRLNELLNELESSKLEEEKVIPERVKSIFEGNKKAFIERIRAFILDLKVPENREDIDLFLEKTSEKLNILSEESQKNYFILKEFVENHTRPITSKIKDIDIMISNARGDFDKTHLAKIKEIRAHHKKYLFLLNEIESLTKELEHTIQMKEAELERKNKFDSKIEELKSTKAYEEYRHLQEREKNLKESVSKLEAEIKELFSSIEYIIKKRHNETQHPLLEKYSSSPIEALVEDSALFIAEEITHMKNNIKDLVPKKEKRESLLKHLEETSEQKIASLRGKLVELKEEFENVNARLKDNHYERSLKERENWVHSINKNIEAIEKKQQDIEDLIERMNIKAVKQKIRDLLKLLDSKVELK